MRLRRVREPEWMDAPDVDRSELARSLSDLEGVNRWLGGSRVVLDALLPMLRRAGAAEARILDVCTGSADIPLTVSVRSRRKGLRVKIVATDLHPATVEVARARAAGDPDLQVECADALDLPYEDGAFHFAMCHTALHHFDPESAVRVLMELDRVATHGVVVTDLMRSWSGLAGVGLLGKTLWRDHPITRHDGLVSIRASYTPFELSHLARAAGLQDGRIRSYFFYNRMALVIDRTRRRGGAA